MIKNSFIGKTNKEKTKKGKNILNSNIKNIIPKIIISLKAIKKKKKILNFILNFMKIFMRLGNCVERTIKVFIYIY